MTVGEEPEAEGTSGLLKFVKRAAAVIVVVVLLGWVIHRAWIDARTIDWASLEMKPGMIGLSVVAVLVAWCWHGVLWGFMLRALGYRVGLFSAARAALVGNLGNYIPGKVFIVILRGKLVEQDGVPMVSCASSVVLETLLRNMVAAILAAVGLWHLGVGGSYLGGLALLLVISLIVVHPRVFNPLTDWVLRKLNRSPLPCHLRKRDLAALLVGYGLYWSIYAMAFFFLARGTLGAEWSSFVALTVALLISLIASMLAVFTPVGLGVADATLAGVLTLTGAVSGAGVFAVIMRVWRTVTELAIAGVGYVLPFGRPVDFADGPEEAELDQPR